MGACLCKTKRRSTGGPDIFQANTSSASSSSSSTTSATTATTRSSRSTSSNATTATTHQHQRIRLTGAGNLLDELSLTGSQADLTYYLSHNNNNDSNHHINKHATDLMMTYQSAAAYQQVCDNNNNSKYNFNYNNDKQQQQQPNNRIWSLQNKLSMHADRLVCETLESIKPTALNEPSNAMQKLHLISETEIGWLVVINSLINKVDLEHPFGSALILLILEDAPLPTKKSIYQLDEVLGLSKISHSHSSGGGGGGNGSGNCSEHRSVARQRNISIVLGCLAEKLAGTFSSVLFTQEVENYLLSRLEPERNEPVVILYSLIALEKFSQTIDNKMAIMKRLTAMGSESNPLLKLERLVDDDIRKTTTITSLKTSLNFLQQQVAFCATWDLDNYFLHEGRPYSYEIIDRDNLNVMLNSRDASENLKISSDGLMARNDTSRFESVRCTWPITSGCYYYEVRLITPGVMQIGFATKQSKFLNHDGFGIGDDDQSFAYDGCRQLLWQNAKSTRTDLARWKEGDIVGCLIDLDKFEIRFSLNGRMMSEPNSDLFQNKPLSTQYYAAASFMPFQQCAFNFGRVPFVYPPEIHNFRALNQCATLREDEKYIIPRHLLLKRINYNYTNCNNYNNSNNNSNNTNSSSLFMNACNICCDNVAQVTLEPCEHDGFCETCASLLDLCPLCRTTIHSRRLGELFK